MRGNLCDEMHFTVEYLYKMASSLWVLLNTYYYTYLKINLYKLRFRNKFIFSSESFIFVFLGVSVVSSNHVFDWWFITATLVGCFVFRFLGTKFLNIDSRGDFTVLVVNVAYMRRRQCGSQSQPIIAPTEHSPANQGCSSTPPSLLSRSYIND